MSDTKLKSFNDHLAYVQKNSPYYKSVLAGLGLLNKPLKNWGELEKLPLTTKDDVAQNEALMLSAPISEVRDIATTSGTLGAPITVNITDSDLDRLAKNESGSYKIAGCTSQDVFQLLTTIDKRFMAGLAYFLGVRDLGARIVRTGPGAVQLQWDSILRYEPTVLIAVPSFVPRLLQHAAAEGIDPNSTSVKKIVCIGEPVRNDDLTPNHLAKAITDNWNVKLFSTYASTEMATAFTECGFGTGAHLQPDLVHLEVLNENNKQVGNGDLGEVVVTPIGVEGLALIRYRTGDICRYFTDPCPCGRPGPRLGPVVGRKQQMLKLKGTSLYPNAVIDALAKIISVKCFYLEASSNDMGLDELTVFLSLNENDSVEAVSTTLAEKLRVRLRLVLTTSQEVNKKKFNENDRKPKIFFDLRTLKRSVI